MNLQFDEFIKKKGKYGLMLQPSYVNLGDEIKLSKKGRLCLNH